MKKKLFTLALALILFATAATGTLAYFTSEDEAHNVITSSGVDIEILEWQKEGDKLVEYPKDPVGIMPGTKHSKIVEVKNLEAEAWVRMAYDIVIKDKDGKEMKLSESELGKIVSLNVNTEKWTAKDGWYYYKEAVKTDVTTAPLFTEVVFSGPNMGNVYQNCTFEINVYAEAVQSANNGATALEAAGWAE